MSIRKLLVITEFGTLEYRSIREASRQTGISPTRISRALNHSANGIIPNTDPVVCVDVVDDISPVSVPHRCANCPYYKAAKNA